MLKKLNKLIVDAFMGEENLIQAQIIIGLFGIFYGLVAFFYFFFKISQPYSVVFLLSISIGLILLIHGRREIIHGKTENRITPY